MGTKNCLVTRLKASVENEDLNKLGVLHAKVVVTAEQAAASNQYGNIISIVGSEPYNVSLTNDKHLWRTNASIKTNDIGNSIAASVSQDGNYRVSEVALCDEGTYYVEISNKYCIKTLLLGNRASLNVEELNVLPSLNVIYLTASCYGNLDKCTKSLNEIIATTSAANVIATTEELGKFTALTRLDVNSFTHLTGDIKYLGTLVNLTTLNIRGSQMTGDLVEFIQQMVKNGVTTKSFSWQYLGSNSKLKFNGNLIRNASSNTLAWQPSSTTGKTTVTLTVGSTPTTIDVDNI